MSYVISNNNGDIKITLSRAGAIGVQGIQGIQGVGIQSATIDARRHLILTLGDGTELDAGLIDLLAMREISNDWAIKEVVENGSTNLEFRYQLQTVGKLFQNGDLSVSGDINVNETFAAASTYASEGNLLFGNTTLFEESLTNSLFFSQDDSVTMTLSTTGDLTLAGDINANQTF